MFQTLYDDLPAMSTTVLALRKQFWEADGYHLILNVPLHGADVERKGPLKPFAGLCIAFLIFIRNDHDNFCPQVGKRPTCYQVGYSPMKNKKDFGLISIANTGGSNWVGYREPNHPGFAAGYYYVCFYFKNHNTLHGYINELHLASDNANPYEVNKCSEDILFGQGAFHQAENLEVHWVVWGDAQNKFSSPSQSLKNQLFETRNMHGEYHYETIDIFDIRTGSVITVVAKYEPNTYSNRRTDPNEGIHFGLGIRNEKYKPMKFPECKDTSKVYTFQLNVMGSFALAICNGTVRHTATYTPFQKHATTESLYFVINHVKPARLYFESMGYRW